MQCQHKGVPFANTRPEIAETTPLIVRPIRSEVILSTSIFVLQDLHDVIMKQVYPQTTFDARKMVKGLF
jgi:hypothetical protein